MTHEPSHNQYTYGCRCEGCTFAHREYTRSRRAQSLAEGRLTHGKSSTYDAGCRCAECLAARQVKYVTGPSEYKPKRRRRVGRWETREGGAA